LYSYKLKRNFSNNIENVISRKIYFLNQDFNLFQSIHLLSNNDTIHSINSLIFVYGCNSSIVLGISIFFLYQFSGQIKTFFRRKTILYENKNQSVSQKIGDHQTSFLFNLELLFRLAMVYKSKFIFWNFRNCSKTILKKKVQIFYIWKI
jgi:hypothetical protein